MVEGKMGKFYEEVCLYEQPFIKDQTISVSQLIATVIGKLGENISVKRFARLAVELERSHQALGEEALADLFAKYKA